MTKLEKEAVQQFENEIIPLEIETSKTNAISDTTANNEKTTNLDTEKIELFTEDNVFDDKNWNKIWEYNNNDNYDPDFDGASVKEETIIAQVHESSQEVEDNNSCSEVTKITKHVVVILPDASSQETSSDEDSCTAVQNIIPEAPDFPYPSPPLSPKPPPLPMGNLIEKTFKRSPEIHRHEIVTPEIPAKSEPARPKVSSKAEAEPSMRSLQEELKTTLRLRNQRQIDQIENTVVNVSEGIEIFGGGKRSRTTSLITNTDDSIKSAMKAGKFDNPEFVSKLNNILQKQAGKTQSALKRPAPVIPRPKQVIFVSQKEESEKAAANTEMTIRMQQMRGTLEQVLNYKRPTSVPSPNTANSAQRPQRPVPKSLDALGPSSEIQIVSR